MYLYIDNSYIVCLYCCIIADYRLVDGYYSRCSVLLLLLFFCSWLNDVDVSAGLWKCHAESGERDESEGCHGLTVGLHGMTYFAYGVLPDKILNFQLGGISGKSLSSKDSLPFMFPIAGDLSERWYPATSLWKTRVNQLWWSTSSMTGYWRAH